VIIGRYKWLLRINL